MAEEIRFELGWARREISALALSDLPAEIRIMVERFQEKLNPKGGPYEADERVPYAEMDHVEVFALSAEILDVALRIDDALVDVEGT